MLITHKFVLNTIAKHKPQAVPRLIMLRITSQRVRTFVATGVYVRSDQFNPTGEAQKRNWIRRSHAQQPLLNTTLQVWHERITTLIQRLTQAGGAYTAAEVKARLLQSVASSEPPQGDPANQPNPHRRAAGDPPLTNRQRLLIHAYEEGPAYRRGDKAYNDYMQLQTPQKRTAYASGSASRTRRLIADIETIKPYLTEKAGQQADREIIIMNGKK